MSEDARIQRAYYERTADRYDEWHVAPGDEHYRALHFISGFVDMLGLRSALDVGTGTGRGMLHLRERHPQLEVRGVEPVAALVERAVQKGVPREDVDIASGERLPYEDGRFDAVLELGVLHHVARSRAVVEEMTRVARRAVFLSDNNCFGWGDWKRRLAKNALGAAGLLRPAIRLKNRGRTYMVSEDDGLAYTYSVLDEMPLLREWADEVVVIPTAWTDRSWWMPRLTASHVLVCALRR